jgi:ribosomal protein L32
VNIFDMLFGCWHRHLSFPFSVKRGQRRSAAASQTGTYVVCLDCGKQFPYDWNQMHIVHPQEKSVRTRHPVEVEKAA